MCDPAVGDRLCSRRVAGVPEASGALGWSPRPPLIGGLLRLLGAGASGGCPSLPEARAGWGGAGGPRRGAGPRQRTEGGLGGLWKRTLGHAADRLGRGCTAVRRSATALQRTPAVKFRRGPPVCARSVGGPQSRDRCPPAPPRLRTAALTAKWNGGS
ncbi:hypothetical protein NDU88_007468 [Pleurodeles waltl]|uniref:Uncharacterized protein n=1 Tax=Pleurodeles waltl TaxID=8319 RepID=A0AAV7NAA0_PLEWA|nr:hypothetical protein NDU88_007468 [Pleurodeles waltl]